MTTPRTRRPPVRKAPGSALLLERRDTAPEVPDPDEKQEIVIEPNLPVTEPSPTPAGPAEPEDEPEPALEDDIDVQAGLKRLEDLGQPVDRELTQEWASYLRLIAAMSSSEPVYLAGNRAPRLKVGAYTLQPGEVVPGAHGWPRRETYERLGRIERA